MVEPIASLFEEQPTNRIENLGVLMGVVFDQTEFGMLSAFKETMSGFLTLLKSKIALVPE